MFDEGSLPRLADAPAAASRLITEQIACHRLGADQPSLYGPKEWLDKKCSI